MVALTVEMSSARLVSGVSQLEHVYIRAPPGCSMNVLPILYSLIKRHYSYSNSLVQHKQRQNAPTCYFA